MEGYVRDGIPALPALLGYDLPSLGCRCVAFSRFEIVGQMGLQRCLLERKCSQTCHWMLVCQNALKQSRRSPERVC